MKEIEFKINEMENHTVLYFELKNTIAPESLEKIEPPKVNGTKGVILSGRGPIWLYCFLTHHYHPTKFVAIYDPRLGGAVVVESHTSGLKVGNLILMKSEVG
ncbi:MAG: CRISPR-associated ring nuclease Crn3/Csx3 [Thermoplasmatales archaeon]